MKFKKLSSCINTAEHIYMFIAADAETLKEKYLPIDSGYFGDIVGKFRVLPDGDLRLIRKYQVLYNPVQYRALLAKKKGIKYVASVVKQVFNSRYYRLISIDKLILTGSWPKSEGNYAREKTGVLHSDIDWTNTITRIALYAGQIY